MEDLKQNLIVICGPTASGKTALALQLAKEFSKVNILNVDSRQVYKGLDTLTGKDIPKNLPNNISIFGLDLYRPDETANLGDFTKYAKRIITKSKETKTPLIIVGGTGLYLKAITENLSSISIPPNPKLRRKLEKLDIPKLQDLLQKKDPQKFVALNHSDILNPRRLIRAIEISSSARHCERSVAISNNKLIFHWVGLMPNKKTLDKQIKKRVIQRINNGAIEEVTSLIKNYPNQKLSIYTSLGVSQICTFLSKKYSLDEMINFWTKDEIDYARRQIVWFKKQPSIIWYDKDIDIKRLVNILKNKK